ncbi:MAG: hypothetical protein MJ156_00600 [Alphaproteobacteria bacterium]|nr:hypothetical protein [Alphaproteobacteria bacterium]
MVKKNKSTNMFDADNLRLILLCAIFGIFGVHKFAQHKIGQGIAFILLDLTVIGFVITCIWSLVNLIQFTTKNTNPSGNIICGFILIFVNIFAMSNIGISEYDLLNKRNVFSDKNTIVVKNEVTKKQPKFDSKFFIDENMFNNNTSYKTSCKSTTNIVNGKSTYTMHCDCDIDKNGKHFHDSFDDTKQYDRILTAAEQDCKKRCSSWCKLRSESF